MLLRAVIPSTASRCRPHPLDRRAYRRRNVIERMLCKLKNWRRIATRHDRMAQNCLAGLALAALFCGWICMNPQPQKKHHGMVFDNKNGPGHGWADLPPSGSIMIAVWRFPN
ncbi:MAG: transposase [Telmatospirillum sp.]|nr:transposase [Telmatospirillum sp.]